MTNKLERLRELVRRAHSSEHYWQQQASALAFAVQGDWLLDRLEKLEVVFTAAEAVHLHVMPNDEAASVKLTALQNALAAVEEKMVARNTTDQDFIYNNTITQPGQSIDGEAYPKEAAALIEYCQHWAAREKV